MVRNGQTNIVTYRVAIAAENNKKEEVDCHIVLNVFIKSKLFYFFALLTIFSQRFLVHHPLFPLFVERSEKMKIYLTCH